jgi:phosphoglycerate kinase
MAEELSALDRALGRPERPVVAIVGGAKVSTKLDLLANLVGKVDHLVIGGGMANTFLAAQGYPVGHSLHEPDLGETARSILARAEEAGCQVVLPRDIIVAKELVEDATETVMSPHECPDDMMILDVGPASVSYIDTILTHARTLVWNGPLGAFETRPFDAGTHAVARKAADLTRAGSLVSVAGGGDTVAALNDTGVAEAFTYVSTAGGAFLEWMEGKTLPGVAALG